MAGSGRALAKPATIRDVAHRAGVSAGTVSNVLNATRPVAPDLAARVRAAVSELGYVADAMASRLRRQHPSIVGVVVPDLANPFFASFVAHLEKAARADGFDVLVMNSDGDPVLEAARLRALMTWRCAGAVAVPCDDRFAARATLLQGGMPVVVADRIPLLPGFDVVAADNHGAVARVVQHLRDQGHGEILAVASDLAIGNVRERWDGARAAAQALRPHLKVAVLEAGMTLERCRAGFRRLGGRDLLRRGLGARPAPSAVFALTNTATLGALGALSARGLAVPHQVALVGYDDDDWMSVASPALTAVRQPIRGMALAAWSRLAARLRGDASPPSVTRLDCLLAIRASSLRGGDPLTTAA